MSAAEPQPSKPDAADDPSFNPQVGLDELRAELEQLAASIDEAGQQIVEITEEQSDDAVDQVEAERQIAELRETMRQQQEELERRQQEIEERQAALAEREQQIQAEKSELQQQLEQRQQQIAERQQHVEQLQAELTQRERSLDGEKGQVDQRAEEIKAQQAKLAAEQAELERWQKQLERREKRSSSSYPVAGEAEHPSPYIEKSAPPPPTPAKPSGSWATRLLIDAAIILVIAAGIVGYYLYSQHQIGLEHRIVAVQRAIGDIQAEAIYRGATGSVDHLPNGYPLRIETSWFDQLPVNSLVGSEVPWLQIVGRSQRNLLNPPDIVATKHAAAFWYNPYRGLIRARVPGQFTPEATVELYNRINNTRVDVTQVVQPD